jgi:hypothetical protein
MARGDKTIIFRGERLSKADVVRRLLALQPELLRDRNGSRRAQEALAKEGVKISYHWVAIGVKLAREAAGVRPDWGSGGPPGRCSPPEPSANGHAPAAAPVATTTAAGRVQLDLPRELAWALARALSFGDLGTGARHELRDLGQEVFLRLQISEQH